MCHAQQYKPGLKFIFAERTDTLKKYVEELSKRYNNFKI